MQCGVSREGHGRDRLSLNYRSFMFGKLPPPACPGLCYVWGHIIPILTVLTISEVGPHSTWPRNMAWPCGAGCGLNGTIWVCLKIEYPQFQWIISMFPLKKWQFIGILYFQANPCSKHFVPQPHVPMRETNLYTLQDHTSSSQLAEVRET